MSHLSWICAVCKFKLFSFLAVYVSKAIGSKMHEADESFCYLLMY